MLFLWTGLESKTQVQKTDKFKLGGDTARRYRNLPSVLPDSCSNTLAQGMHRLHVLFLPISSSV
jgi:hypothetical protein